MFLIFLTISCSKSIDKPNLLFIIVDDLGWTDVSYNGSDYYETHNIDALSLNSMLFYNAYAASPVCSPTRASIMTGKHNVRINITDWIPGLEESPNYNNKNKPLIRPKDLEGSLSVFGETGSVVIGGFAVNEILTWNFKKTQKEDENIIKNKLLSGKKFVWLKRNITPTEHQKIIDLGEINLEFHNESKRIYPFKNSASHIVGFVNIDQIGQKGIERSFNKNLSNEKDVTLSIDINLQQSIRHYLLETINHYKAESGLAIVMDICLLYTSPSPRDQRGSRMPSSA